jgi:hypothetical protein
VAITSSTEIPPAIDPRNYVAYESLKDGTEVTIRAIRRDDKSHLREAFKNLDRESIYRRFFTAGACRGAGHHRLRSESLVDGATEQHAERHPKRESQMSQRDICFGT